MTTRLLSSRAGFTYIGALVMVIIMGIMLSQAALYWSTRMQQDREEELLYKGVQIRDAMRKWYAYKRPVAPGTPVVATPAPAKAPRSSLPDLEALVVDPSTAAKEHLIRPSVLKVRDPLTNKESEWVLWKNPQTGKNEGVFLKSESTPRKQGNFPEDMDLDSQDFEGKSKYSEWVFIFNHFYTPPVAGGAKGLKGASPLGSGAGGSSGGGSGGSGSP